MNPFSKLIQKEAGSDHRLGSPARDEAQFLRRNHIMFQISGGRGWRIPKKEPRQNAQGLTRGDRKRIAREKANAVIAAEIAAAIEARKFRGAL